MLSDNSLGAGNPSTKTLFQIVSTPTHLTIISLLDRDLFVLGLQFQCFFDHTLAVVRGGVLGHHTGSSLAQGLNLLTGLSGGAHTGKVIQVVDHIRTRGPHSRVERLVLVGQQVVSGLIVFAAAPPVVHQVCALVELADHPTERLVISGGEGRALCAEGISERDGYFRNLQKGLLYHRIMATDNWFFKR